MGIGDSIVSSEKKIRTVFLAALMFLWVFAGTVAFAGGAAALTSTTTTSNLDISSSSQAQTIEFTAEAGTDYDSTASGSAQVTFNMTEADSSLSVSSVENIDGSAGTAIDSSSSSVSGAVTSSVGSNGEVVTVTIDESATSASTSITVNFDITVDASSATVQSTQYTFESDGGSAGSGDTQTSSFEITNTNNPAFANAGNIQPGELQTGQSSTTQSIDPIEVDLQQEGGTGSPVTVNVDVSSLSSSAGATLSGSPGAGVAIGSGDITGGSVSGSPSFSTNTISVDVSPDSGVNSFTIDSLQLTNIDTTTAGTAFGLTYSVDINSGTASTIGSFDVTSSGRQDPTADGSVNYDAPGTLIFQGQDVYVYGDDIDPSGNSYELRSVEAFDAGSVDDSQFQKALDVESGSDFTSAASEFGFTTSTAAVIEIETDDLDAGNYFVVDQNGNLPTDGQLIRSGTFEVGVQDLETVFDEEDMPVLNDDLTDSNTELDIESSRGSYTLNVTANGDLSSEELFNIFAPETDLQTALNNRVDEGVDDSSAGFGPFNAAIYTTENSRSDDRIALINVQDTENDVDFTDIPSEDYNFNFDVTDTEAQASSTVTVFENIDQSNLTYTFEIPNDGEMYSLGIPGETQGTLADIVDPTAEGYTVFRFVDGEWTPVTDFESTTLNALDAIAIATEGASGQPDTFSLDVELATQSATTVPPQASLTEGWNFVAAPQRGDADTVLAVQHSFLVLDRFNQPSSEYLRGVGKFNTHYIGSDSQTVSPFKGYYVYAEDDTTLPGVLTGVETRTDVDEQLNLDTFSNPQNAQDELAEAQARINELEDQNAKLEDEVSGLESDVSALESENADLESEIDDLEAELQQCRAEGS
ncbi:probable secreted glycoprotein [Natronomonas moolapensis 8.8.11]|uniref:Probable secreted glycoprotein n=1 Tax=Natronomonas moolapensis (strain DSM 18674 / CECT 7526 / JCM 14361 / 8.8.11) TaxID=268739 RepID=M1XPD1_NATM8|nr:surface glycoprotein [Natronomonas moolapensis]CCQ35840.1 probable secreted glycoprotein [Natronomonas moolapensis 8.8.11]